jgi:crotonobetainyl-CoA:carnitine CoA-transferase CaiB-like acyl-CoA transferase
VAIPKGYLQWVAKLFDPTRIDEKPEALRGVRVLDLSVSYFGPASADFLGELGRHGIV